MHVQPSPVAVYVILKPFFLPVQFVVNLMYVWGLPEVVVVPLDSVPVHFAIRVCEEFGPVKNP